LHSRSLEITLAVPLMFQERMGNIYPLPEDPNLNCLAVGFRSREKGVGGIGGEWQLNLRCRVTHKG